MKPRRNLVQQIEHWMQNQGTATDGELLEHFLYSQDETAFSVLLKRHGPMVLRVCRRALGNETEVEDAFQATFLVLARKAGSIRKRESVASWLHGVAQRLARRVRAATLRRQQREQLAVAATEERRDEAGWRETCALLDEELQRLPEPYQTALVLYYLESQPSEAAAKQLGWSLRTFQRRLEQGRERLRLRLLRRGVDLAAVLLAADLGAGSVPAQWLQQLTTAAPGFQAGQTAAGTVSANAIVLAEGMVQTMRMGLWKLAAMLVLTIGLAGGAVWLLRSTTVAQTPLALVEAEPVPGKAAPAPEPLPAGAVARLGTLRLRHANNVSFMGFSADGKQLLTLANSLVHVWDAATGEQLRTFGLPPKAEGYSANAVLSPDARLLAVTGGPDRTSRIWDVASGKELWQMVPPTPASGAYTPLKFTADGRVLAVRGTNWEVLLRDGATGKEIGRLQMDQQTAIHFRNLTLAPDGQTVATWSLDGVTRLWETASGKLLRQFGKAEKPDTNMMIEGGTYNEGIPLYLANGKQLVTVRIYGHGKWDCTVTAWNSETGAEVVQFQIPQLRPLPSNGLFNPGTFWSLSGDGRFLALPTPDGLLRIYNLESGKEFQSLKEPQATRATLAHDGKWLAIQSVEANRAQLQLIEVATRKVLWQQPASVNNLLFAPDGRTLAARMRGNAVRLWDVGTGREVAANTGHQDAITRLTVTPDGKTLTTLSNDTTLRQWDLFTGKELQNIALPIAPIWPRFGGDVVLGDKQTLSPNGTWVALGGQSQRKLTLLAIPSGRLHAIDLPAVQNDFTFLTDGTTLLVRSADGPSQRLYETATGKLLQQRNEKAPRGVDAQFYPALGSRDSMAVSADGTVLATLWSTSLSTSPFSSIIQVMETQSGRYLGQIELARDKHLESFSLSADGRCLIVVAKDIVKRMVSQDARITVWEIASGKARLQLDATPFAWTVSPRLLAVADRESRIRLWSLADGKEVGQLTGHLSDIRSLCFTPSGKQLVSGSDDTTALVWDLAAIQAKAKPQGPQLDAKQLETLWNDLLDGTDAARAGRAMTALTAAPTQSVPALQQRLPPVTGPDPQRLARLLTELDSNQFPVRQKATEELEKLGELAEPALQKRLAEQPPLETRQRIEGLLAKITLGFPRTGEALRGHRAIEVLERIGTPAAKQVLESLAQGFPGARLTREARQAVTRLTAQTAADPG